MHILPTALTVSSVLFMWLKAAKPEPTTSVCLQPTTVFNLCCPALSRTFTSAPQITAQLTLVFIAPSCPTVDTFSQK